MAKKETQFSRATVLLDEPHRDEPHRDGSLRDQARRDEPLRGDGFRDGPLRNEAMDQFYRPTAAAKPRPDRAGTGPSAAAARLFSSRQRASEAEDYAVDDQGEEVFLRARCRVPVRQGWLPVSRTGRIALAAGVLVGLGGLVAAGLTVRQFLSNDPRFRIDASSSIQIDGNSQVTRPELLAVFGSDIGRNVFFIPLAERRAELEKLPWVAHATVMRLLPNQLRIAISERTPVAFVRRGNNIGLVDGEGVLLNMPPATLAAKHYSFPVVTGVGPKDPASLRAARMHLYQRFIHDLNAGGTDIASQLSEVDISHPEDVLALAPAQGSDVLVHLGEDNFLDRYRRFQQHLPEWRQQYPHLSSVDMRYENQVVLEMAKGSSVDVGQDAVGKTAPSAKTAKLAAPAKHSAHAPAPHRQQAAHGRSAAAHSKTASKAGGKTVKNRNTKAQG